MTRGEWWFFSIGCLLLIVLLLPSQCKADEGIWFNTIVRSYHTNRTKGYNEANYGIGIEVPLNSSWRLVAGEYRNSIYERTVYAGASYLPWAPTPRIRVGATGLCATGYSMKPCAPVFMATATYEQEHWGLNFSTVGVVSALQLKVRW